MLSEEQWADLTQEQRDTLTNNAFVLVAAAVAAIVVPKSQVTELATHALVEALRDVGIGDKNTVGLERFYEDMF